MPFYEDDNAGGPGKTAETWVGGEFLVSMRDLQLVKDLLEKRLELSFVPYDPTQKPEIGPDGVPKPKKDDFEVSKPLGLVRFRLTNPQNVLHKIKGQLDAAGPGEHFGQTQNALAQGKLAVSVLLAYIDDVCRTEYGWIPVTAKNMVGHGVHGSPYIGIGGGKKYPKPVPANLITIMPPLAGKTFDEPNWVNVGILDTALAPRPEFDGRWLRTGPAPVQQVNDGEYPTHLSGHATFIAGMILQLAPNALLHVARVLHPEDASAPVWDVAKAMMRLDKSVQVLNLSFSCFTGEDEPPLALRYAIERLDPTTVVVAAAGNHGELTEPGPDHPELPGPRATMWPAAMDRVVAVGSHKSGWAKSSFSPDVPWVHLTALGEDVVSTFPKGPTQMIYRPEDEAGKPDKIDFTSGTALWSGTSFASALVAGVVAARTKEGPWAAQRAMADILENKPEARTSFIRVRVPLIDN
jgi:subtilisin family serine protease